MGAANLQRRAHKRQRMPDHPARQRIDVFDIAERAEQCGAIVSGQDHVDFRIRKRPLQFRHQRREQQQVAQPVIRAAYEDASNFPLGQIPGLPQARTAGPEQRQQRIADEPSAQFTVALAIRCHLGNYLEAHTA
ncbi:MAG: hypothetical protein JSR56_14870 [Proteobacteria bacterium]|nr:hypothetical protein [Pseudomonadota bacterium]